MPMLTQILLRIRFHVFASVLGVVTLAVLALGQEVVYQQPPKRVLEALRALPTPGISVSPQRDYAILTQSVRYPSITEVAQPMLRLAGIRIDSNTNGMHLAQNYVSFSIRRLSDGAEIKAEFPHDGRLGAPIWSPDGKQFAFTNTTVKGIDLWVAATATGQMHQLDGVHINGVVLSGARSVDWMGNNRTLLVRLVVHRQNPSVW